jgi:hypothetical protein
MSNLFPSNPILKEADGSVLNATFSPSIATDDLTLALKTLSADDPSTDNFVQATIGGEILSITSALSITITDAMGDIFSWDGRKIQGNDSQLFVYLINNNGTAQIGVSPSPNRRTVATNYYDAGGQTGSAGFSNIVMSGTRNATNTCAVVGRVNVKQEDDNTWVSPTISCIVNRPIYETDWLDWTPDLTIGNPDLSKFDVATYQIVSNHLFFFFKEDDATLSGTAGALKFSLPVAPIQAHVPVSMNNSSGGAAYAWAVGWTTSAGTVEFYKNGATTWAADETATHINIRGDYEI